ncbi:hypothetical protein Zm00014a_023334 [Zea mays]|uniref:Uncharacterized protein n=1 Tax=Zea mays TaxID=4577 RepID=A0A3L6DN28_MAIZE|nr:hypothetical protein Zm00014a_023334 [Zea mays]
MLGRRGEMGYEEGELELEEGEAASGGGGGGRELVMPDALTCIDERIQNVLGHLRKKFEGEITHMNLGSMYGCHGSFLPTYPRSPLGFPQYRNTADPKNHGSASRSLHVLTEVHFTKFYIY